MKITAFNGRHRAEKGNTNLVVEEFLRGAREVSADTENISLAKMNIKPCINCFTCWMETPGDCLVDDDMKELMLKFINSDLVIMATSVYVDNVTAIMKMFLERLIHFSGSHFEYDENGETRHAGGKDNPPMAIIATCAFPEQSQLDIIEDVVHRVSRSFHTRVVAEIFKRRSLPPQ